MKKLLIRSGSIVLSATLLAPGSLAYAEAMATDAASPASASAAAGQSSPASPALPVKQGVAPSDAAITTQKVKITKEAALKMASAFVPAAGMELENVSFRSADTWRTFPEWTFYWVKKSKTQEEIDLSYSVGIHANTGELTAFSYYDRTAAKPDYANRISYADAQATAQRFFAENLPAKRKETRLYMEDMPLFKTPLHPDASYTFRFVRLVNDVPFPDNSVDITINPAGKVSNLSVSWSDTATFESANGMLTPEEAAERFRSELAPDLSYVIPWEAQGEMRDKPILVYANPFSLYLDAKDGSLLTPMLSRQEREEDPVQVSKTPLAPRHRGPALTQNAAVSIVDKAFGLSGYSLRSANYSERDYRSGKAVWYLDFENKEKNLYASAAVEASTGDIYTFHNNRYEIMKKSETTETKKSVDKEALRKKAVDDLKRLAPTLADKLYLVGPQHDEAEVTDHYTVNFIRLVNGIRAATGSAHLTYNTATGELSGYNIDIGRESYPAKLPAHLSAEKAAAAWLKEAQPEAVYMLKPQPAKPLASGEEIAAVPLSKQEAELVYRMKVTPYEHGYFLDAQTGEWRSQATGKAIELHRTPPADLEGHQAEKELLLMYEYDALSLVDGKILPNKEITRGEMIEMLMLSLNQGRLFPIAAERKASFADVANTSRYFAAVEAAVDRGLLDKNSTSLKPDEKITREELADMLVRALGYSKLAEHSEMFHSELTDIGQSKHKGAIIIVSALGIMDGKDEFRPASSVSRADAAIAFVRFLEKRSQLEAPPFYR